VIDNRIDIPPHCNTQKTGSIRAVFTECPNAIIYAYGIPVVELDVINTLNQ